MYNFEIDKKLQKSLKKLTKKNPKHVKIITKKIRQIVKNPYHFKPLRGDLSGLRRVHIDKSFVLVYEILEKKKLVRILDYEHHDKIY